MDVPDVHRKNQAKIDVYGAQGHGLLLYTSSNARSLRKHIKPSKTTTCRVQELLAFLLFVCDRFFGGGVLAFPTPLSSSLAGPLSSLGDFNGQHCSCAILWHSRRNAVCANRGTTRRLRMYLLPSFQRPGFDYAANFCPTQSRQSNETTDAERMRRGVDVRGDSCGNSTQMACLLL